MIHVSAHQLRELLAFMGPRHSIVSLSKSVFSPMCKMEIAVDRIDYHRI